MEAPPPLIETTPYRVSRTDLARLAMWEYVRSFWWFVGTIPLFGLFAFIFGSGVLQAVGLFGLLWPFSIPARSVLSTNRSAKLFCQECRLLAYEDRLEFQAENPNSAGKRLRMVIPVHDVRDIIPRGEHLLVRTRRFGFAPIARSSLQMPGQEEHLRELASQSL